MEKRVRCDVLIVIMKGEKEKNPNLVLSPFLQFSHSCKYKQVSVARRTALAEPQGLMSSQAFNSSLSWSELAMTSFTWSQVKAAENALCGKLR